MLVVLQYSLKCPLDLQIIFSKKKQTYLVFESKALFKCHMLYHLEFV